MRSIHVSFSPRKGWVYRVFDLHGADAIGTTVEAATVGNIADLCPKFFLSGRDPKLMEQHGEEILHALLDAYPDSRVEFGPVPQNISH